MFVAHTPQLEPCYESGFCIMVNTANTGAPAHYKCSILLDKLLTDTLVVPWLKMLRSSLLCTLPGLGNSCAWAVSFGSSLQFDDLLNA